MGEPSDGASSAPARAFVLPIDLVHAPPPQEWRPVVKVAEYIPKVPGEPKRTLWRLNSSNIRKYQGIKAPSIGLLNSGVDSSSPLSDLVQAPPPEEWRPVVKVAQYMPKILGEAKRTLWRANSSNMYKYQGFSWPRVVGLKAHKAKRIIRKGKPELHFEVLPENAMRDCVSRNFRVTLIVEKHNRVVETPRVC
ncbi:hypothetical protein CFC21_009276 [Triticum aestivum]|uniref:MBD domain-containing protein n=2 Tax=Triticum aestivum TaxID=4565 RepID=A0A9R1ITB2_WHEAT|nr:uncharacterized protein LOC123100136 [Triticum aestivum]KAF6992265.1 hypothetical protein CFC21_009276 [Triticum aestivum]